jgi:hypothetical protein
MTDVASELKTETIWIQCENPECKFELTLVLKPAVVDQFMLQIKKDTVPCWACGKEAKIVKSGGSA